MHKYFIVPLFQRPTLTILSQINSVRFNLFYLYNVFNLGHWHKAALQNSRYRFKKPLVKVFAENDYRLWGAKLSITKPLTGLKFCINQNHFQVFGRTGFKHNKNITFFCHLENSVVL